MNHLRYTISLSTALLVLAGLGGCGKWGSTYESGFQYKDLPVAGGTATIWPSFTCFTTCGSLLIVLRSCVPS